MPGMNQRGPAGAGAMTGRGRGICQSGQAAETSEVAGNGRGLGLGRGRGQGYGVCRRLLGPGRRAVGLVPVAGGAAATDPATLEELRQSALEKLARIEAQIAEQTAAK